MTPVPRFPEEQDWEVWLLALAQVCVAVAILYGYSTFLLNDIYALGYDRIQSQFLTSPRRATPPAPSSTYLLIVA